MSRWEESGPAIRTPQQNSRNKCWSTTSGSTKRICRGGARPARFGGTTHIQFGQGCQQRQLASSGNAANLADSRNTRLGVLFCGAGLFSQFRVELLLFFSHEFLVTIRIDERVRSANIVPAGCRGGFRPPSSLFHVRVFLFQ